MARQLGQSGRGTTRYYSVYWGALPSSGSGNVDHRGTWVLRHEPPSDTHVLVWYLWKYFYVSWYPPFMTREVVRLPRHCPDQWPGPFIGIIIFIAAVFWNLEQPNKSCSTENTEIYNVHTDTEVSSQLEVALHTLHWQHCRPSLIGKIFPLLAASWAPA